MRLLGLNAVLPRALCQGSYLHRVPRELVHDNREFWLVKGARDVLDEEAEGVLILLGGHFESGREGATAPVKESGEGESAGIGSVTEGELTKLASNSEVQCSNLGWEEIWAGAGGLRLESQLQPLSRATPLSPQPPPSPFPHPSFFG